MNVYHNCLEVLKEQIFRSPSSEGFFLYFFNWRKLTLQCWVGFCHTTMRISHNYTYIPSLLSLPPLPPSLTSRPSQSTWLGSLCFTATSHQLFILHMIVYIYINPTFSICPTLSFPHYVHHSILYVLCLHFISVNKFISNFSRFHICVLIYNIFFSF